MADPGATIRNMVQDAGDAVGQAAASAADSVRSAAGHIGESAKDAASKVNREGRDAASYLGHKAEDAANAVGGGLKSAGSAIRQNGPGDGVFGQASVAVASTLEQTGNYLQDEGLQGLGGEITNLIRKNPIPALLVGVGIGYLVARATSSK